MTKEKSVIFFVYNGSAEVDWILPILNELSNKNYKIFTYFRSKAAFSSLKSNDQLFYLWNKINKKKYIDYSSRAIFWKFLRKIIYLLGFNKNFLYEKISNKINDFNFVKKKFKIKNNPEYIFSEFGINSGWVSSIKNNKSKSLIIHHPSTPYVYLNKPKAPKFALRGDALILGNKLSIDYFSKQIKKSKIFVSGNPSFDNYWVNKIINSNSFDFNYKKLAKKKKFLTIAYSSFFGEFDKNTDLKLEKHLVDIMDMVDKFKDLVIIFKIHPRKNNPKYLDILKKYDKKKWIISKSHLIKLAKISELYLHPKLSATLLDSILVKTPTVQYWSPSKKIHYDPNDTYEKINLVVKAENKNELKKHISDILIKKKLSNFYQQRKNFKKIFYGDDGRNSINNFIKIINKFKH